MDFYRFINSFDIRKYHIQINYHKCEDTDIEGFLGANDSDQGL